MANEIVTEIRLELDKFRADLKEAQKAGEESGKKAASAMGEGVESGLGKVVSSLKGELLALAGVIAGAFAFKESIKAAIEQENAINALNSAMAVTGTYTDAASAHLQAYADQLQKTTIYGHDVIEQGQAMLTTLGRLSGQGLDRATQASLDLAAALHIDVNTAFELVGKAATGHVQALSRYGIQVRRTGDDARDFASALKQLETRFSGLAQLQANTFDGAMKQSQNSFKDLLEVIGNVVVKSPTMIALIKTAGEWFTRLGESIQSFTKNRDLINELGQLLVKFGGYVNTYLVVPLEFGFNILRTGALTIATAFVGLISVLTYVDEAIQEYLVKPIEDFIGAKLGALVGFFDKDLGDSITNFTQKATQGAVDGLQFVHNKAAAVTDALAEQTANAASKTFDFSVASATEGYLKKSQEFFNAVTPVAQANFTELAEKSRLAMIPPFESGWDFITNGFNFAFSKVQLTSEKFRAELQLKLNGAFASFRDGFANSFQAIGAALVKGEDAFAAFGKALLGVFGDLAIQVGSFYFLLGLGNLFFNPAAAAAQIGAGLALMVLGGALKALSGGSASAPAASGAASTGGGVAANGGAGTAPVTSAASAPSDSAKAAPTTQIHVNVQGHVFDRRETGLAIADAINEAFGSNGVVFAQ